MHYRFYGSNMGRFMKPDNVSGNMANPQSWNKYSYVAGNPVNMNDPTGHLPVNQRTFSLPSGGTAASSYEVFENGSLSLGEHPGDTGFGPGFDSWFGLAALTSNDNWGVSGAGDEEKLHGEPFDFNKSVEGQEVLLVQGAEKAADAPQKTNVVAGAVAYYKKELTRLGASVEIVRTFEEASKRSYGIIVFIGHSVYSSETHMVFIGLLMGNGKGMAYAALNNISISTHASYWISCHSDLAAAVAAKAFHAPSFGFGGNVVYRWYGSGYPARAAYAPPLTPFLP